MRFLSREKCLCLITGLAIGFLLWGFSERKMCHQTTKVLENNFRFEKMFKTVSNDKTGERPEDDTSELIELVHEKLIDLKEAGMLENIGKQRMCSSDENVTGLCIEPNCHVPLARNISPETIRSIRKPVKTVGMDKLKDVIKAFDVKPERNKYVIIIGGSSDHFDETQGAIQSLHENVFPTLSNYSFYYYDLGLSNKQRDLVQKYSGAELRTFPFDKLPERVRNLKCYLWKPLLLLAHFQQSEFLLWMDASVRYTKDIRPYFETVSKTGILITPNKYQMIQHTYWKLFSYFGDEACQFGSYTEVETGLVVFHNEPFTRHLIVEPWSACALDPNCMCPKETEKKKVMLICRLHIRMYGKCHRYDQSVIGLILIKLFRENRPSVIRDKICHKIKQRQRGSYLVELHKTERAKRIKVT